MHYCNLAKHREAFNKSSVEAVISSAETHAIRDATCGCFKFMFSRQEIMVNVAGVG